VGLSSPVENLLKNVDEFETRFETSQRSGEIVIDTKEVE
jgi:hypothetical protein